MKIHIRNFALSLSAGAFIRLNSAAYSYSTAANIIAIATVFFILSKYEIKTSASTKSTNLLSTAASLGIIFYQGIMTIANGGNGLLDLGLCILSIPFIYLLNLNIWGYLIENIRISLDRKEKIVYLVEFLMLSVLIIFAYQKSEAFYYLKDFNFDILYTSDSIAHFKVGTDINWFSSENNIRQPLFAVFTTFITGIIAPLKIFLLGANHFGAYASISQIIHLGFLFTANLILSEMLKLKGSKKFVFLTICNFSYTGILFSLMLEQYIFAYFWLMVMLYTRHKNCEFSFVTATGSMLTTGAMFPFTIKKYGNIFKNGIYAAFITVISIFAFGKGKLLITLPSGIKDNMRFTETSSALSDKLMRYLEFIKNLFYAPSGMAGVPENEIPGVEHHIGYILNSETSVSIIGILLFTLCIISFWIHRKDELSQISMYWIVFSLILFIGLGWGIRENGLILYSLYFFWAVWTLLFKLLLWLEEKTKIKHLTEIIVLAMLPAMLYINIQEISNIMSFMISTFPH